MFSLLWTTAVSVAFVIVLSFIWVHACYYWRRAPEAPPPADAAAPAEVLVPIKAGYVVTQPDGLTVHAVVVELDPAPGLQQPLPTSKPSASEPSGSAAAQPAVLPARQRGMPSFFDFNPLRISY